MAVKLDIIDGNRGRITHDGWEFDRIATVTGLTGDGHARLYEASTVAGMPQLYSVHPSVPFCYLMEKSVESIDSETVQFRLYYKSAQVQLDTIEIGGTLSQGETSKDVYGNRIEVGYKYPADYQLNTALQGQSHWQGGTCTVLLPQHSIIKSRREFYNPSSIAKEYLGAVNSGPWSLDMTAAARTWLCTGIVGRSSDGERTYSVTYSFQYNADTWDLVARFLDPNTGKPPVIFHGSYDAGQPTPDDVQTTWHGNPIKNFNNLGL